MGTPDLEGSVVETATTAQEQPTEPREPAPEEEESYSFFTKQQLYGFQLILGIAATTSPLTATIYFPLLPLLRQQFHVSAQAINLTLTLYVIFQALSPVIFGPFSDSYGRRPVFIISLAIYVVGNIGIAANQSNYAALLVLRAVQSLGASAAYALAFGVISDLVPSSKRGSMVGPINMTMNLGTCVGPLIGGIVAYTKGEVGWVFWALVIIGVLLLTMVMFCLPETSRNLVGKGDDSLYKWWQFSLVGLFRRRNTTDPEKSAPTHPPPTAPTAPTATVSPLRVGLTNLLRCFRIIFHKDTLPSLWLHASFYAVDYCFVAAVPDIFVSYNFNELQIGLAYLPRSLGIITSSYFTGRLMDYNYRVMAKQKNLPVDKSSNNVYNFPIEEARSRSTPIFLLWSTATMLGYGWAVQRHAHPSVPLILQFMQGFWQTNFYTTYSTLFVDMFPEMASTAAAATAITRCAMAATAVAILDPVLKVAGRGWFFTGLGLWSGVFGGIAVVVLQWKGTEWRRERTKHTKI